MMVYVYFSTLLALDTMKLPWREEDQKGRKQTSMMGDKPDLVVPTK